ncbi:response regulator transcription factor [Catenulispora sp. NL8]|uniref:Response regulator transcription factor n=1 Tax=Catenulispora pinistramenti TaxID=2705254 RepID=A0ABS5L5J3_9ACTN|nr:response regulator transcription factor [Catenulispora pinistramenti]MBS2553581.1 response regulator transcription factor [Catenulispora pinistramenti]
MRVLVAEDHRVLARTVATGLRREAMAVDLAFTGAEAERMCLLTAYDVLILDRDLPVLSGDEVCRRLRELTDPPQILMLTAAGALADRVYGLTTLGADDYLGKPFDFGELVARVRALSRRAHRPPATVLRSGNIALDETRHEASVDGRRLELTPKEFAVLRLLLAARGAAVQHDELVRSVWDEHQDRRTGAVRATVSRLRGKLGDPGVIVADRQGGYRLCD